MRIISGKRRGLRLLPPKTDGTRPITDRVKESIFNILYNKGYPEDKRVADVFCGTGSFGIESISRGASFCLFIEKDFRVVDVLKKNLEKAQFLSESKIISGNAFKIGAPADFEQPGFDLVFVDPPYALSRDTALDSQLGRMLLILARQINQDGLAVVRTEDHIEVLDEYGSLKVVDRRQWGTMKVAFLQNQK